MSIYHTLEVVAQCWKQAEKELRVEIQEDNPGVNEEFITRRFHGKFSSILKLVSKDKRIEKAFQSDLEKGFPAMQSYKLSHISTGLIADVVLHERTTEKDTGGDIGLSITRPSIEKHLDILKINHSYRRGLLCQAKLKQSDGKWGNLTYNQKKVLPTSLSYLGILLYEYEDQERRSLKAFQWQLCSHASNISDVNSWLQTGKFPAVLESDKIIKGLGESRIGTDNKKTLDEIIAPEGNTSLEIIIKWDDDSKKPGSEIYVKSKNETQNVQKVYLK